MARVEVVGRLAEIVQADDPFGVAEAGYQRRDVLFQVDVLDSLGDGRTQKHQPVLLVAGEAAAVGFPPAAYQHRRRAVGQQPRDVHLAADIVQAQLDQSGTLLDQVPMLGKNHLVTTTANADADHG